MYIATHDRRLKVYSVVSSVQSVMLNYHHHSHLKKCAKEYSQKNLFPESSKPESESDRQMYPVSFSESDPQSGSVTY